MVGTDKESWTSESVLCLRKAKLGFTGPLTDQTQTIGRNPERPVSVSTIVCFIGTTDLLVQNTNFGKDPFIPQYQSDRLVCGGSQGVSCDGFFFFSVNIVL